MSVYTYATGSVLKEHCISIDTENHFPGKAQWGSVQLTGLQEVMWDKQSLWTLLFFF